MHAVKYDVDSLDQHKYARPRGHRRHVPARRVDDPYNQDASVVIGDGSTSYFSLDRSGWPVLLADGSGSPVPVTGVVSAARSSDARRDLVRELAREFDDLSIQDLRERTTSQASNELAQLQADVRAQVLDDLLDVLDQRVRGRLRKRRTVRVQAPRGYVRRVLAGISAIESEGLAGRLRDRGWSTDDIARTLPHQRSSMSLLG